MIVALHEPVRAFEDAEAVVFVDIARSERGTLSDHPLTDHLLVAGDRVVDLPVAPEELGGLVADVLDADEVDEDVLVRGAGMAPGEHRLDGDPHPVGEAGGLGAGVAASRIMVRPVDLCSENRKIRALPQCCESR